MLLLILSNAPEWRVYPEELAKRTKDSFSSVRRQLDGLEKAGYIRTYRKFLGRGKGSETYRFCADRKISDEMFEYLISTV
ncbi:transcriptional regulator [Streptococcus sp. zg-JUN1979]|uniref:transcriptional regulator n=1 Tax=Streptococcus sp. zg-JUN1979 TaxID=3391450 RepID=UPI0039A72770